MSSKKVASKDTKSKKAAKPASKSAAKAPAKKPAAKAAPSKKAPAPAKKAAPSKKAPAPAKKAAPSKKAPAPAKKATPSKKAPAPAKKAAPSKKAPAPAKAVPEKKAATKAKAPAKTATKAPAKPAAKPVSAPKAKASAKTEPKAEPKKDVKVSAGKAKKAPAAAKAVETVEVNAAPVEPVVEDKSVESKKKNAPDYAYAVLLQGVKRLSKTIMFVKVDESEDRANKKKMSSDVKNLDMKPTSALRHKASLAEETQEELTERILKELEEQNKMFEREVATQMCTRCNRNLVSPEFWVDKHLGFCEECAAILKLGQSKEARKVEYQLGAMDGDSLDEEDDDIIGPDADDLKAAEEDLAEMDD